MFLTILILLTVGQLYFEFKIVRALGLEQLSKRFALVNLAISIIISIGAMTMFPAAGMVVASAGILSTVLSQPMYQVAYAYQTNGKPKVKKAKASYDTHKEQIHQTMSDLSKIIVGIALIITFPFRVLRWCIRAFEATKTKLARS